MESIFQSVHSTYDSTSWAVQKGVELIKTGGIYYAVPLALSGYLAYNGLYHAKTAIIGVDSFPYRVEILKKSLYDSKLSHKERIQHLFHATFGSISLKDRAKEAFFSSLHIGGALLTLYALHTHIEGYHYATADDPENPVDIDSSTSRDFYYDSHTSFENQLALGQYKKNKETVDAILLNSQPPELNRISKQVIAIADQALLPAKTTFRNILYYGQSLLNTISFGITAAPAPHPSTESMSLEELNQAYEKTRELLEKNRPTFSTQQFNSKMQNLTQRVCDWTWGYFVNSDPENCEKLASHFSDPSDITYEDHFKSLDDLYRTLSQRAILQERGQCPDTEEVRGVCSDFFEAKMSRAAKSMDELFKTIKSWRQEFVSLKDFGKFFPLSQKETDPEKFNVYREALIGLKSPENNAGLLKVAVRSFFPDLSLDFTKKELHKAFRKLSITHHADKADDALSQAQMGVATTLVDLFDKKNLYNATENDMSSVTSRSIFHCPTPMRVIQDLFSHAVQWWKSDLMV